MAILRWVLVRSTSLPLRVLVVLLIGVSAAVAGQHPAALQVHVITENGERLPAGAEVMVSGLGGSATAMTDTLGYVEFSSLPAGFYEIKVAATGIAANSSETVEVHADRVNAITLRVRLVRPREATGRVSAAELSIPSKAKKELRKANELVAAGKFREALEHCRKALALHPAFAAAYNTLGVIADRQGDRDEARRQLLRAVEIDPAHAEANANLARLALAEQDWAEAERRAQRSAQSDPADPKPLVLLALAQFKLGKLDDVVVTAHREHVLAPAQYSIVHFVAATALRLQQRKAEAIAEYKTFLEEAPEAKAAPTARQALAALEGR